MQIKTTRHYVTLVRTAIIKKSINNKSWWGCGEKGTLLHSVGTHTGAATTETECRFLKKLEPPCDPAILLLGIHPTKLSFQMIRAPYHHGRTIHKSQDRKTTQTSAEGWADKEDVVHTHSGVLLSHTKESKHAVSSDTDGPRHGHTERSESERKTPQDSTYTWNVRYDRNERIYETASQTETNLWLPRGKGGGREGVRLWD